MPCSLLDYLRCHRQLKRIYDAIIRGQRKKLESEFIANVGELMGGQVVEENPI